MPAPYGASCGYWNRWVTCRVVEKQAYWPFHALTKIYSAVASDDETWPNLSSGPLTNVVDTFEPDDSRLLHFETKGLLLKYKGILTYISEAVIVLCDLRRQRPLVKGCSFSPATWRLLASLRNPAAGRQATNNLTPP